MKKILAVFIALLTVFVITPSKAASGNMFADINAPDSITIKDKVTVAVIDTGINCSHPALKGAVKYHYDAFSNEERECDGNCTQDAIDSHGTNVAGLIAGNVVGGMQIGVAPKTYIYDLRALNQDGIEGAQTITKCIDKAVELNVDIINLSCVSNAYDIQIDESLRRASENGILVVCASGNESSTQTFQPSDVSGAINVNSSKKTSDGTYELTEFSNYGWETDISAPGEDLLCPTIDDGSIFINNDESLGSYAYLSGTSVSCPLVSATVALLKSNFPLLSSQEIKFALYEGAFENSNSYYFGKGNLNVQGAFDAAQSIMQSKGTKGGNISLSASSNILTQVYNTNNSNCITLEYTLNKFNPTDYLVLEILSENGNIKRRETIDLNNSFTSYEDSLIELNDDSITPKIIENTYENNKGILKLYYDYNAYNGYFSNNFTANLYYVQEDITSYESIPIQIIELAQNVDASSDTLNSNASCKVALTFDLTADLFPITGKSGNVYSDVMISAADGTDYTNITFPLWTQDLSQVPLKKGTHSVDIEVSQDIIDQMTSGTCKLMITRGTNGDVASIDAELMNMPILDAIAFYEPIIDSTQPTSSVETTSPMESASPDVLPHNSPIYVFHIVFIFAMGAIAMGGILLIITRIRNKKNKS